MGHPAADASEFERLPTRPARCRSTDPGDPERNTRQRGPCVPALGLVRRRIFRLVAGALMRNARLKLPLAPLSAALLLGLVSMQAASSGGTQAQRGSPAKTEA